VSKVVLKFILFFYPSIFVFAQHEPVKNFSVKDGLPSGRVYDCVQDRQGFMWFATAAGLARFDGTNFKVFTTEDGLTNNEILQLALDRDGSIWIIPFGTSGCIYDPASQKLYNEQNYPELRKIKEPDNLWIRNSAAGLIGHSETGIFLLENKRRVNFIDKSKLKISFAQVHDVWPLNKDSMIIFFMNQKCYLSTRGDTSGLDITVPGKGYYTFPKSPDWGIWKIFINSPAPTRLALYEYINDGSVRSRAEFNSDYAINSVTKYDQKIYIATSNGVNAVDTLLQPMERFFQGKNISKVFIDNSGNEWICSLSGEGVYLRLKNGVRQLSATSGLPDDNVSALRMNQANELYCGDESGNIYSLDLGKEFIKPVFLARLPEAVRAIELYKGSFLAYSNYKLYANNKFVNQYFGPIKSVIMNENDELLVGSQQLLTVYNRGKKKFDTIGVGKRYTTLSYLEQKLYFGNNEGLFEYDKSDPYRRNSPLLKRPINYLIVSKDGILWVATNNDGIMAMKNDKIIGHFTTSSSPSITSNICRKLFYDKTHNVIWIATNKGVNSINYSFADGSLNAVTSSITASDGLNDDDVNDVCVKDGKVFAATIKGICIFNADLKKSRVPVRVTDVFIKGYTSPDSSNAIRSNYKLTHRQNNISISYAGICFTCDKKLVYQYRMMGVGNDSSWKTTTANTVEFGELTKGNHVFQVRTDPGNMQELRFRIEPAFWQTNWFYTLGAAVIIGIFLFSIMFVARRIRKREKEKATISKRFAELEFQALQAQMNPHFVFNAMNTLQNYILKNESENASEYLAKFARLMRLFLESSRNKFVELNNEIELLRNYIELEQARLQHGFDYQISIDPEVDMDTKIPSVMIQPFVENAILHGLRHKTDGNGLLELHFGARDHILECRIRDNGIGRQESERINKAKDKLYKSQALTIIDEKVKTLKEINNVDIKIAIDDELNENGKGAGTTVTIQFGLSN